MIAFGSQRANGADLATHLMNSHDNECVNVVEIRGAIADDLAGAFAEWKADAKAMTNLTNYLYSLSINSDPRQGPLSDAQKLEYADRAGISLGLENQPRAIIDHIKEGDDGVLRSHTHVVWSRTDVQNQRGINISFDKRKLMMVSREFAQTHGMALPDGYRTNRAQAAQVSLYEKVQQETTGISKEDRMTLITDLWRSSDSPKAFVAALEDNGYMLATGRRPYVLVDTFGNMNALPKMIDDKSVRTKDIRAFLEKDFPVDSLSTVEEAREIAAKHNEERKQLALSEKLTEQKEILKRDQAVRKENLDAKITAKTDMHMAAANRLADKQADKLYSQKLRNAQEDMQVNFRRAAYKPTGLAAFLSRISGVDKVRGKLHEYQDKKRGANQEEQGREIELQNQIEKLQQQREQGIQMMELRRRENEQEKLFEREARSIEMAQQCEKVVHYSKGHIHMPSVHLALTPPGRRAMTYKAMRRYYAPTVKEPNIKVSTGGKKQSGSNCLEGKSDEIELKNDFTNAANFSNSSNEGSDDFLVPDSRDLDNGRAR